MAILHLSTDTQCVGTQKDKMDGSGQNPIDVHGLVDALISSLKYYIFRAPPYNFDF